MNDGYQKSVQKLAWDVSTFAERDFDPLIDELNDIDAMEAYLDQNPEKKFDWDNVENESVAVCNEHKVSYERLMTDVWDELMKTEILQAQNNVPSSSASINTN